MATERSLSKAATMMSLKDWILSSSSSTTTTTRPTTSAYAYPAMIRLMDGGVSTHLEKLLQAQDDLPGAAFSHRALWSSSLLLTESGRNTILQGHKDWLAAGSDIVTTVTYQCHFGTSFGQQEVEGEISSVGVTPAQMTTMMKHGVQLADQAIAEYCKDNDDEEEEEESKTKKDCFVVASSGCYGAALADGAEYTGIYPHMNLERLADFHMKKAKVLLDAQPDGLAIETIPSVEECAAVCVALKSLDLVPSSGSSSRSSTNTAATWISLACQDGATLNEGKPLVDALATIREHDPRAEYVHAIGVNCCDSAHIASLLEILTKDMALKGPRRGIVMYPNSGEEWDASKETWREGTGCTDEDIFSDRLMEAINIVKETWKEHAGGRGRAAAMPKLIVGGCCRTSPETIAALRRRIDEWQENENHA